MACTVFDLTFTDANNQVINKIDYVVDEFFSKERKDVAFPFNDIYLLLNAFFALSTVDLFQNTFVLGDAQDKESYTEAIAKEMNRILQGDEKQKGLIDAYFEKAGIKDETQKQGIKQSFEKLSNAIAKSYLLKSEIKTDLNNNQQIVDVYTDEVSLQEGIEGVVSALKNNPAISENAVNDLVAMATSMWQRANGLKIANKSFTKIHNLIKKWIEKGNTEKADAKSITQAVFKVLNDIKSVSQNQIPSTSKGRKKPVATYKQDGNKKIAEQNITTVDEGSLTKAIENLNNQFGLFIQQTNTAFTGLIDAITKMTQAQNKLIEEQNKKIDSIEKKIDKIEKGLSSLGDKLASSQKELAKQIKSLSDAINTLSQNLSVSGTANNPALVNLLQQVLSQMGTIKQNVPDATTQKDINELTQQIETETKEVLDGLSFVVLDEKNPDLKISNDKLYYEYNGTKYIRAHNLLYTFYEFFTKGHADFSFINFFSGTIDENNVAVRDKRLITDVIEGKKDPDANPYSIGGEGVGYVAGKSDVNLFYRTLNHAGFTKYFINKTNEKEIENTKSKIINTIALIQKALQQKGYQEFLKTVTKEHEDASDEKRVFDFDKVFASVLDTIPDADTKDMAKDILQTAFYPLMANFYYFNGALLTGVFVENTINTRINQEVNGKEKKASNNFLLDEIKKLIQTDKERARSILLSTFPFFSKSAWWLQNKEEMDAVMDIMTNATDMKDFREKLQERSLSGADTYANNIYQTLSKLKNTGIPETDTLKKEYIDNYGLMETNLAVLEQMDKETDGFIADLKQLKKSGYTISTQKVILNTINGSGATQYRVAGTIDVFATNPKTGNTQIFEIKTRINKNTNTELNIKGITRKGGNTIEAKYLDQLHIYNAIMTGEFGKENKTVNSSVVVFGAKKAENKGKPYLVDLVPHQQKRIFAEKIVALPLKTIKEYETFQEKTEEDANDKLVPDIPMAQVKGETNKIEDNNAIGKTIIQFSEELLQEDTNLNDYFTIEYENGKPVLSFLNKESGTTQRIGEMENLPKGFNLNDYYLHQPEFRLMYRTNNSTDTPVPVSTIGNVLDAVKEKLSEIFEIPANEIKTSFDIYTNEFHLINEGKLLFRQRFYKPRYLLLEENERQQRKERLKASLSELKEELKTQSALDAVKSLASRTDSYVLFKKLFLANYAKMQEAFSKKISLISKAEEGEDGKIFYNYYFNIDKDYTAQNFTNDIDAFLQSIDTKHFDETYYIEDDWISYKDKKLTIHEHALVRTDEFTGLTDKGNKKLNATLYFSNLRFKKKISDERIERIQAIESRKREVANHIAKMLFYPNQSSVPVFINLAKDSLSLFYSEELKIDKSVEEFIKTYLDDLAKSEESVAKNITAIRADIFSHNLYSLFKLFQYALYCNEYGVLGDKFLGQVNVYGANIIEETLSEIKSVFSEQRTKLQQQLLSAKGKREKAELNEKINNINLALNIIEHKDFPVSLANFVQNTIQTIETEEETVTTQPSEETEDVTEEEETIISKTNTENETSKELAGNISKFIPKNISFSESVKKQLAESLRMTPVAKEPFEVKWTNATDGKTYTKKIDLPKNTDTEFIYFDLIQNHLPYLFNRRFYAIGEYVNYIAKNPQELQENITSYLYYNIERKNSPEYIAIASIYRKFFDPSNSGSLINKANKNRLYEEKLNALYNSITSFNKLTYQKGAYGQFVTANPFSQTGASIEKVLVAVSDLFDILYAGADKIQALVSMVENPEKKTVEHLLKTLLKNNSLHTGLSQAFINAMKDKDKTLLNRSLEKYNQMPDGIEEIKKDLINLLRYSKDDTVKDSFQFSAEFMTLLSSKIEENAVLTHNTMFPTIDGESMSDTSLSNNSQKDLLALKHKSNKQGFIASPYKSKIETLEKSNIWQHNLLVKEGILDFSDFLGIEYNDEPISFTEMDREDIAYRNYFLSFTAFNKETDPYFYVPQFKSSNKKTSYQVKIKLNPKYRTKEGATDFFIQQVIAKAKQEEEVLKVLGDRVKQNKSFAKKQQYLTLYSYLNEYGELVGIKKNEIQPLIEGSKDKEAVNKAKQYIKDFLEKRSEALYRTYIENSNKYSASMKEISRDDFYMREGVGSVYKYDLDTYLFGFEYQYKSVEDVNKRASIYQSPKNNVSNDARFGVGKTFPIAVFSPPKNKARTLFLLGYTDNISDTEFDQFDGSAILNPLFSYLFAKSTGGNLGFGLTTEGAHKPVGSILDRQNLLSVLLKFATFDTLLSDIDNPALKEIKEILASMMGEFSNDAQFFKGGKVGQFSQLDIEKLAGYYQVHNYIKELQKENPDVNLTAINNPYDEKDVRYDFFKQAVQAGTYDKRIDGIIAMYCDKNALKAYRTKNIDIFDTPYSVNNAQQKTQEAIKQNRSAYIYDFNTEYFGYQLNPHHDATHENSTSLATQIMYLVSTYSEQTNNKKNQEKASLIYQKLFEVINTKIGKDITSVVPYLYRDTTGTIAIDPVIFYNNVVAKTPGIATERLRKIEEMIKKGLNIFYLPDVSSMLVQSITSTLDKELIRLKFTGTDYVLYPNYGIKKYDDLSKQSTSELKWHSPVYTAKTDINITAQEQQINIKKGQETDIEQILSKIPEPLKDTVVAEIKKEVQKGNLILSKVGKAEIFIPVPNDKLVNDYVSVTKTIEKWIKSQQKKSASKESIDSLKESLVLAEQQKASMQNAYKRWKAEYDARNKNRQDKISKEIETLQTEISNIENEISALVKDRDQLLNQSETLQSQENQDAKLLKEIQKQINEYSKKITALNKKLDTKEEQLEAKEAEASEQTEQTKTNEEAKAEALLAERLAQQEDKIQSIKEKIAKQEAIPAEQDTFANLTEEQKQRLLAFKAFTIYDVNPALYHKELLAILSIIGENVISEEHRAIIDGFTDIIQGMGVRIPSTAKNNAILFEVAGFLKTHSNVIIAPQEIVKIHGSDYDIDKLKVFFKKNSYALYKYKKEIETLKERLANNPNDKEAEQRINKLELKIEEEQAKNDIIGILEDILLDPVNIYELFTDIDFENAKLNIASYEEALGIKLRDKTLPYTSYQGDMELQADNMVNLQLVGLFATSIKAISYFIQGGATFSYKDGVRVTINPDVSKRDAFITEMKDGKIQLVPIDKEKELAKYIKYLYAFNTGSIALNAAIDAVKEQIHGAINNTLENSRAYLMLLFTRNSYIASNFYLLPSIVFYEQNKSQKGKQSFVKKLFPTLSGGIEKTLGIQNILGETAVSKETLYNLLNTKITKIDLENAYNYIKQINKTASDAPVYLLTEYLSDIAETDSEKRNKAEETEKRITEAIENKLKNAEKKTGKEALTEEQRKALQKDIALITENFKKLKELSVKLNQEQDFISQNTEGEVVFNQKFKIKEILAWALSEYETLQKSVQMSGSKFSVFGLNQGYARDAEENIIKGFTLNKIIEEAKEENSNTGIAVNDTFSPNNAGYIALYSQVLQSVLFGLSTKTVNLMPAYTKALTMLMRIKDSPILNYSPIKSRFIKTLLSLMLDKEVSFYNSLDNKTSTYKLNDPNDVLLLKDEAKKLFHYYNTQMAHLRAVPNAIMVKKTKSKEEILILNKNVYNESGTNIRQQQKYANEIYNLLQQAKDKNKAVKEYIENLSNAEKVLINAPITPIAPDDAEINEEYLKAQQQYEAKLEKYVQEIQRDVTHLYELFNLISYYELANGRPESANTLLNVVPIEYSAIVSEQIKNTVESINMNAVENEFFENVLLRNFLTLVDLRTSLFFAEQEDTLNEQFVNIEGTPYSIKTIDRSEHSPSYVNVKFAEDLDTILDVEPGELAPVETSHYLALTQKEINEANSKKIKIPVPFGRKTFVNIVPLNKTAGKGVISVMLYKNKKPIMFLPDDLKYRKKDSDNDTKVYFTKKEVGDAEFINVNGLIFKLNKSANVLKPNKDTLTAYAVRIENEEGMASGYKILVPKIYSKEYNSLLLDSGNQSVKQIHTISNNIVKMTLDKNKSNIEDFTFKEEIKIC